MSMIDRHLTKNREWFREHDEFLNDLAEVLIHDSERFGTCYGWSGKLIVPFEVARPAPSEEEAKWDFFKRGERWRCVLGPKFAVIYSDILDANEVMLTSPYGTIHSELWDKFYKEEE